MTVSVIVITLNRPECVRKCLECLAAQTRLPEQVMVVDASPGEETRAVVEEFREVKYLRNDGGMGRMTVSRNIGLMQATGEIIAFVDDDAFAHEGWLAGLLAAYTSEEIGAVGGRALNNQPEEETRGVDRIGRLNRNGELEGWFAADPGTVIEVDHVMGCNMSFRRSVLAQLGGFREDYPGISGIREDSDMCLRVKQLGYRVVFTPFALVDHLGAPQVKGRRFDARYAFYANRNHMVMLVRNFGLGAGIVWGCLAATGWETMGEFCRRIGGAILRLMVSFLGMGVGMMMGLVLLVKTGRNAVRRDAKGRTIREAMARERIPENEMADV
jgi:GT2 family glycosyltransferase